MKVEIQENSLFHICTIIHKPFYPSHPHFRRNMCVLLKEWVNLTID